MCGHLPESQEGAQSGREFRQSGSRSCALTAQGPCPQSLMLSPHFTVSKTPLDFLSGFVVATALPILQMKAQC